VNQSKLEMNVDDMRKQERDDLANELLHAIELKKQAMGRKKKQVSDD
jgi:hypothetical protein